jgi:hypothetical protein
VQENDTPAQIAAKLTGSPGRMTELVAANPQKARRGATFASLYIGEKLAVPSSWGSLQGLGRRLLGTGDDPTWTGQAAAANALLPLVQAIAADANYCTSGNANVLAFQQGWNGSAFVTVGGQDALTEDGEYGSASQYAATLVTSTAPSTCTSYASAASSVSAAATSAAQALDQYLAANGCAGCTNGDTTSQLATLTYALKEAVVTPGAAASTATPTSLGQTVNMVGAAAYAYGPGTDSILSLILGSSRTYTGGPCTDSAGNCLSSTSSSSGSSSSSSSGGSSTTSTSTSSSSSSAGTIVAALVLIAGAGGALYYMKKHPPKSRPSSSHALARRTA